MKTLKLASLMLMMIGVSACSTTSPNKHWQNFDNQSDRLQLAENQSGLVVYRSVDQSKNAISVNVNGQYFTSLQPEAFANLAVCLNSAKIEGSAVRHQAVEPAPQVQVNAQKAKKSKKAKKSNPVTQPTTVTFNLQQVSYVKVSADENGKATISPVSEQIAREELSTLKHQINTLSRVNTNCQ